MRLQVTFSDILSAADRQINAHGTRLTTIRPGVDCARRDVVSNPLRTEAQSAPQKLPRETEGLPCEAASFFLYAYSLRVPTFHRKAQLAMNTVRVNHGLVLLLYVST